MVLCTNFAKGQDYIIRDNITLIDGPTTFIQSNPYPTSTSTSSTFEVGKGFTFKPIHSIFYGGNLGVSQATALFGNYGGKWSITGAYQRGCIPAVGSTVYGLNFLATQHLWGNYDALFGLRADSTLLVNNQAVDTKNMIISKATD